LQALIASCVKDALKVALEIAVPSAVDDILELLSGLVADGRRTILNGWGEEITFGDREDPIRVYQQLRALLISLAAIHGTRTPTPRAIRLVRDVALGTFEPRRAEALLVQRMNPVLAFRRLDRKPIYVHGLTAPRLTTATDWSPDTADRVLKSLVALRLYEPADSGVIVPDEPASGRSASLYVPASALACVLNASFETYPPSLVTIPELLWAEDAPKRLSAPDARLARAASDGRVELHGRLATVSERLLKGRPGLSNEELAMLALDEVLGLSMSQRLLTDKPIETTGGSSPQGDGTV
jgi:hypothetical protein